MTSTAIVGSTGLVGAHILNILLSNSAVSSVHAYSRRDLPEHPNNSSKLQPLKSTDTSAWASLYPKSPSAAAPAVFFSGLGTTRATAGGTDKQYEIDYTLNLNLATAAKEAGSSVYVLISSKGASHTSSMFYPRMKGELEEAVKKLGFEHTVILQPGLIVGGREESRLGEGIFRGIATGLGKVSSALKDGWAQDADVIAKAAVKAGLDCADGKREKGVWLLTGADIIKLGRTEWTE